ncbi:hypothetical protein SCHPADRAFT_836077 [Schizopora paradoxa]|uniref:Clp1-like protein n=1 Tax=Schizopora paradoxa TaxID=27342 RepID=A0A0H2RSJ1_9AGAM|nr:hypothetical protein SCHPADRAFT_836077 [Schizopora paradoxa]
MKAAARRRRTQLLKPLNASSQLSYHPPTSVKPRPVEFSEAAKRRARLALSPVKVVVQPANKKHGQQAAARFVSLPIRLARPVAKEVSRDALAAVSPELADTPAQFVREALELLGTRMLAVLASTATSPVDATNSSSLPTTISVTTTLPVSESSDLLPTHMLAVHSSASTPVAGPSKPRKVTLFPAHATVLAANCVNLPPLPRSTETTTDARESPIQGLGKEVDASLPLVPLALPSPETFAQLSTFLYTRRADQLLASLMPAAPSSSSKSSDSLDSYATQLSSLPRPTLLAHALRVHGLWKNACALGVHDAKLWSVIDSAWTTLVRAMGMVDSASSESS